MVLDSGPFIEQIEMLQEEIRELRSIITPPDALQRLMGLGLTATQAAMVAALMRGAVLSRHQLMTAMYPDVDERYERESKNVDAQLAYLRKRLKPHGVTVGSHWGKGFYLPEESRANLKSLMDRQFLKQAAE